MLLSYLEAFEFSAELYRRSYRRCSKTKGVLNIFAKLTGVISKVAFLTPTTLLKERLWYMCFPVNFAKLLRTPILENICKRLIYLFIYLFIYFFIYLFIYLFILYLQLTICRNNRAYNQIHRHIHKNMLINFNFQK